MNSIHAGIVQLDVNSGNIDANIDAALNGVRRLADRGANLAVLPEMWTCGFDNANLATHARRTPEILERLSRLATECDIIIAGSAPEHSGNEIFNTLHVVDKDGSIAGAYKKIHLFRLTEEDKYFGAGHRSVVCETTIGPIGLMICYDLRFPELCRSLALDGAVVVVICAQWPMVRIPHWDILIRARAIENQLFMVAANRCGNDPGLEYGGRSMIASPGGDVLAAAGSVECLITAELDPRELDNFRKLIPCLKEREPDAYAL